MLELKVGNTYRHKRCLDVDLFLTRININSNNDFELGVIWVNRNYKEIISPDTVTMKRSEMQNWKVLEGDESYDF